MDIVFFSGLRNGLEVTIARPQASASNSNQYFFSISGLDSVTGSAEVCIVGDWEFEAFTDFLYQLRDFIEAGADKTMKKFKSQSGLNNSLFFVSKADQREKVSLKFDFEQTPVSTGHIWPRMPSSQFGFYIHRNRLEDLSYLISQFDEEGFGQEPLLIAHREDWIVPGEVLVLEHYRQYKGVSSIDEKQFIFAQTKIKPALLTKLQACEVGLIRAAWSRLIEAASGSDFGSAVTCPQCSGLFFQDRAWKHTCIGCYKNLDPTALKPEKVDEYILSDWFSVNRVVAP